MEDNEIPPHFVHETKTKSYVVVNLNVGPKFKIPP